jgi:hypothetical protein
LPKIRPDAPEVLEDSEEKYVQANKTDFRNKETSFKIKCSLGFYPTRKIISTQ